jgi:hypothetical protein
MRGALTVPLGMGVATWSVSQAKSCIAASVHSKLKFTGIGCGFDPEVNCTDKLPTIEFVCAISVS